MSVIAFEKDNEAQRWLWIMDLYNTISACQAATVGTETVQIQTHTYTSAENWEL